MTDTSNRLGDVLLEGLEGMKREVGNLIEDMKKDVHEIDNLCLVVARHDIEKVLAVLPEDQPERKLLERMLQEADTQDSTE